MAHFFFDICTGTGFVDNGNGLEFASVSAAHRQAMETLATIVRDEIHAEPERTFRIRIRDSVAPLFEASVVVSSQWMSTAHSPASG